MNNPVLDFIIYFIVGQILFWLGHWRGRKWEQRKQMENMTNEVENE